MKFPKTVTINSLGGGVLTVTVKIGMLLKARIRLALFFIRLAGWLLNRQTEIKESAVQGDAAGELTE